MPRGLVQLADQLAGRGVGKFYRGCPGDVLQPSAHQGRQRDFRSQVDAPGACLYDTKYREETTLLPGLSCPLKTVRSAAAPSARHNPLTMQIRWLGAHHA